MSSPAASAAGASPSPEALYIGLMSGTSLDGVDAALARFDPTPDLLGLVSRPMPDALRAELLALQSSGPDELHRAALAANALADLYADAVADLLRDTGLDRSRIAAIGAHGQTVRHRPELGFTLQLNNASRLAERAGIAVVADLRSRDVAAGGQGAPLVCAFHRQAFAHPSERRAVVNIGGIVNATLVEPDGSVVGWDCGPGNVLMDGWCERHLNARFDTDGRWATSGRVVPGLLAQLLDEPYFGRPAPKSTGRDLFGLSWLDAHLRSASDSQSWSAADVQATLLELTATTIAQACAPARPDRVLLCGGGAANRALRERIADRIAPVPVGTTTEFGVPTQAVEALAFAWLAHAHLRRQPGNLPRVTGAEGGRILGALYPA